MGEIAMNDVVQRVRIDGVNYEHKYIACGKKSCTKCPHGPYWYANVKTKGVWREIYVGKEFMTLKQYNERKKEKAARGL